MSFKLPKMIFTECCLCFHDKTNFISEINLVKILSPRNTPIRYKRPLFRYGIWARIRGERTLPAICLQQYSAGEAEFSLRNSTKVSQIFTVLLSLRDLISRNSFLKSSCIRFARSDYRYSYICFVLCAS